MTTHAAALIEKIPAEIQRVRALGHAIVRVTLLATGFSVLFLKQGSSQNGFWPCAFRRWWSRDHCPSGNPSNQTFSGL